MRIFHITDHASWNAAKVGSHFQGDTLESEGFIHCCKSEQVEFILKNWFKGVKNLVILEIETDKLTSRVKFENLDGREELFPHIYGLINLNAVVGDTRVQEE